MSTEMIPFTQAGYDRLNAELENLKKVERPKVIEEIATARAHGDLKENAEYHAAREKQGFIEGRIAILEDQIARANVLSFEGKGVEDVRFSAIVTVEDLESGEERKLHIVGDLEADISEGRISIGSPLAKALLGKRVDDEVEVKVPKGIVEYLITSVEYE